MIAKTTLDGVHLEIDDNFLYISNKQGLLLTKLKITEEIKIQIDDNFVYISNKQGLLLTKVKITEEIKIQIIKDLNAHQLIELTDVPF